IVQKPSLGIADTAPAMELLRVVKSMAEIKTVRHWSPDRLARPTPAPNITTLRTIAQPIEIVAIGASTGGPQALFEILSRLPGDFATPVLVVQHISPGFATTLVEWLKPLCPLPIQLATTGISLDRPGIFVAPSGYHLVVARRRVLLTSAPPVGQHRPAATLLFQSVAREYGRGAVGVLLSGMGDDGAIGLRDLKRAGGLTIGQDEASSVVFGMAAVAIGLGVVDSVLPPTKIAELLLHIGQFGREAG
ncbi:MAG TPA: CheB methylesterase domain-containing protein, partial [Chloroflexota bacterium]|nr:CheB methylesterase domain-containing protein [Chloroflexota bacterium]